MKSIWQQLNYKLRIQRELALKKALYAKFSQNTALKDILTSTNDALLIHPATGSPRNPVYEIQYELMEVRYLLQNEGVPEFYPNYNKDKLLSIELLKFISLKFSESIKLSRFL